MRSTPQTFDKSTLEADDRQRPLPARAGPRRAKSLTFKRNPDYWAKDLPSKRGFDNYDEIRLTYYRDENAMFEAFKKGLVDVFIEEQQRPLGERVQFPGRRPTATSSRRRSRPGCRPACSASCMNTRRPVFQDVGVRAALIDLFDFEWANRNLFSGAYHAHQELFRQFRAVVLRACRQATPKRRCLRPSPMR